jgi:hypothetical protein
MAIISVEVPSSIAKDRFLNDTVLDLNTFLSLLYKEENIDFDFKKENIDQDEFLTYLKAKNG